MTTKPTSVRRVLYGPTLQSGGAYQALPAHYKASDFDVAIVSSTQRLLLTFPEFQGDVYQVQGHAAGLRLLRAMSKQTLLELYVVQNPALWPYGVAAKQTLIQNTKFLKPRLSLRYETTNRGRARVVISYLLTELQVFRSRSVVTLNPDHPTRWARRSPVVVRPNVLPERARQTKHKPTERLVVFVGSCEPFRHAPLAVEAFRRAGLAEQAWSLRMHIGGGGQDRTDFIAEVGGLPGVEVADLRDYPPDSLASAAVALFPSVMEGSSIAFLEALHLSRSVLALDRPHFRYGVSEGSTVVRYLSDLDIDAWAEALRDLAHRHGPD